MNAPAAGTPPVSRSSFTRGAGARSPVGTLEWILRLGAGLCFIGHGAFGIITKEGWLPFFQVVGIGPEAAYALMPLIGAVDIVVGALVIVRPRPAYLAYMVVWGAWTALLRPLSGMSFWETVERAGNYGVPLALLVLLAGGASQVVPTLRRGRPEAGVRPEDALPELRRILRWTTGLLLLGHGALGLLSRKALFGAHYAVLGGSEAWTPFVGGFEIALAVLVLAADHALLWAGIVAWKLGSEALFPLSGAPVWEFVERAGSYAAPAGLLWMSLSTETGRVRRLAGTVGTVAGIALVGLLVGHGLVFAPAEVDARPTVREPVGDPELVERLGEGGHILACRHAITDRSRGDADRVDLSDPGTQRVLSREGVRQAAGMGRSVRRLDIPVRQVLSSPYQRTMRSAELMFGAARAEPLLSYEGWNREEGTRLFRTAPEAGTNRVLMTHRGILHRVYPDVRRGSIDEGDCLLALPGGRVLGRIAPDHWEAAAEGRSPRVPVGGG